MGEVEALALALEGQVPARSDTSELVALAKTLRELPDPVIDTRFMAALETRLLNEPLETAPTLRAIPATPADEIVRTADVIQMPRRRLVVRRGVVAGLVAASMAAFPLVAAASSLPGSPFYPVKRAIERVQLAFASGPVERGMDYLNDGRTRVSEGTQLVAMDANQALIAATFAEGKLDMVKGSNMVLSHTSSPEILGRMASIATATENDIRGMNTPLSGSLAAQVAATLRSAQQIQQAVQQALGEASGNVGNMAETGSMQSSPTTVNTTTTSDASSSSSHDKSSNDKKTKSGGDGQGVVPGDPGCSVPGSANGLGDVTAPIVRITCSG